MLTLLAAPMAALPRRVAVQWCGGRGCFAVALLGGVMLTLLAAPMAALPVRVAVQWSPRLPIGVAGEGWVERPRRLRCWGGNRAEATAERSAASNGCATGGYGLRRGGWRGCFACSATGLVMLLAAPKAALLRRVAVQAYVLGQGLLWCGAPCAGDV